MDEQIKSLAAEAYNAIAAQLGAKSPFTPFRELPEDLQTAWYMAVVQSQIFCEFPQVVNPIPQGEFSASCVWELQAGVIPGQPMPELTRRWGLTSGERHSEHGTDVFTWRMFEATHQLQQMQNPQRVNWVRLDWVYF